jgi:Domain of unknown function (DUF4129)
MSEDQALSRLSEILARPEFHGDDAAPWWQQLLAPVFEWVWGFVGYFIRSLLDTATGREGSVGLVAATVAIALLGTAAVYLVRAVRLSLVREDAVQRASLAQRRQRSDQLWREAQQLAIDGQLAKAVRLLYLSALYALDERALLHVEQNLTNREHAQRLTGAYPALGRSFVELLDRYERVRYGHAAVARESFADFSHRAERVRAAALSGSPQTPLSLGEATRGAGEGFAG